MKTLQTACALATALLLADAAGAQDARFELGVQVASAQSGQFDAADAGVGGRIAWQPIRLVGLEAELNLYPRSFPDRRPFSRTRVEGLFGATAGVTFGCAGGRTGPHKGSSVNGRPLIFPIVPPTNGVPASIVCALRVGSRCSPIV